MHPRQVRQLRVRGWFPKIAAPVPRGAVSKQVIAVVVRFVTFLSQTEVRAVDASAADGPFVEAVLTVLDTMQRAGEPPPLRAALVDVGSDEYHNSASSG